MKHILALIFAFLVGGHHALQATPATRPLPSLEVESQVRSLAPAALLPFLKNPNDLRVQYLPADFGNTGKYDYIVAAYIVPGTGAKLFVSRNVGGKLEAMGPANPSDALELDDQMELKLEYVDNSGVPIVRVDSVSADGRNVVTSLFRWTGSGLKSMLPPDTELTNASFIDPEGTGVEEIVVPPYCLPSGDCGGSRFEVYRLKNGRYTLVATSAVNPNGRGAAVPQKVALQPAEFSAAEILGAPAGEQAGGAVVLRFGELRGESSESPHISLSDVNLTTLYAGRNVKPLTATLKSPKEGRAEGFGDTFVEVAFPRSGILQYLAKAQPSKPPEPGDVVNLPVNARTNSGLAVYGSVGVKIVGPASK